MSYRGQQEDIFTQELAFTPEMVQATPADIVRSPNGLEAQYCLSDAHSQRN